MNFELYKEMKKELSLRSENKAGNLFSNQTTEQLNKLVKQYEKEIFQYMISKTMIYINKMERCGA